MSEFKVLDIVYSHKEQGFDFIVHTNADKLIQGDERDFRTILQTLLDRLDEHKYPFSFLGELYNHTWTTVDQGQFIECDKCGYIIPDGSVDEYKKNCHVPDGI